LLAQAHDPQLHDAPIGGAAQQFVFEFAPAQQDDFALQQQLSSEQQAWFEAVWSFVLMALFPFWSFFRVVRLFSTCSCAAWPFQSLAGSSDRASATSCGLHGE